MQKETLPPNKQVQTAKDTKNTSRIISGVMLVVWACFIFFMSSRTSSGLTTGMGIFSEIYQFVRTIQESAFGVGVDVLSPTAHFFEYTVLGILLVRFLRHFVSLRSACVITLFVGSLYGVSDEFHQYFVPGRECDPMDWLVDTIGVSVGLALSWGALLRRKRKQKEISFPKGKTSV